MLSQSTETFSKVLHIYKKDGDVVDMKSKDLINHFKVYQDRVDIYVGGDLENRKTFNILSASIERSDDIIKFDTTATVDNEVKVIKFGIYINKGITVDFGEILFFYHKMTTSDLYDFIQIGYF
jgi:hypothetical protein